MSTDAAGAPTASALPGRAARALSACLPFLAFLALYALTLSENLTVAHDSATYLNRIVAGRPAFHPHHLLYEPVSALWLGALGRLGLAGDPMAAVSLLNAVFGALAVQLVFLLLRRRAGLPYGASLLGAALPGLSFGPWYYSTAVEVYVIPLALLLWCLYLLSAPEMDRRGWIAAGAVHGLAALFHQVHVLFGAAVLARLVLVDRPRGGAVWRPLAAHVAAAAVVVVPAYAAAIVVETDAASVAAVARWLTDYAHKGAYWFRPDEVATLLMAVVGFGRSVVGGHFLFGLPEAHAALTTAFADKSLADEAFLVRGLAPPAALHALLLASAALALLMAGALARRLPALAACWRRRPALLAPTLAWLGAYAVFFTFWEPYNSEFWLTQNVCFWLILACLLHEGRPERAGVRPRAPNALALGIAVLLFAVNYFGSIRFTTDRANDATYRRIEALTGGATTPRDLVVAGEWWILGDYLDLFVAAPHVALTRLYERHGDGALARAEGMMAATRARGGRVFVLAEVPEEAAATGHRLGEGYRRVLSRFVERTLATRGETIGRIGGAYVVEP